MTFAIISKFATAEADITAALPHMQLHADDGFPKYDHIKVIFLKSANEAAQDVPDQLMEQLAPFANAVSMSTVEVTTPMVTTLAIVDTIKAMSSVIHIGVEAMPMEEQAMAYTAATLLKVTAQPWSPIQDLLSMVRTAELDEERRGVQNRLKAVRVLASLE